MTFFTLARVSKSVMRADPDDPTLIEPLRAA
jgi:hypothetical protein